jgi:hypothetical protein
MFKAVFLSHPRRCGETYFEHARFALGMAFTLFGAALAALIHALIPALHETTASRTVIRLYPVMSRRNRPPEPQPEGDAEVSATR